MMKNLVLLWLAKNQKFGHSILTHDKINKKLSYDFETYGYCKTNISEDDIWHLVDTLLYNKESDPDVIRAKENEINVHRKSEAMYGDD